MQGEAKVFFPTSMQNTRCVYISGKVCGWDHGLAFVTCRQNHKTIGLSYYLGALSTACFWGRVKSFGAEYGLSSASTEFWFACHFYSGLIFFLFIRLKKLSLCMQLKMSQAVPVLRYSWTSVYRLALLSFKFSWYKCVLTRLTQSKSSWKII